MLYFDHNATTPIAPEVAQTLLDVSRDFPGNASSIHRVGQAARGELEKARVELSSYLRCLPSEIVWTSGGTESNNLAIFGLLPVRGEAARHIVTSTIEHPSVAEPIRFLERQGCEVSSVRASRDGQIDIDELARQIRPDTALVSVMHANNETGVIQPIEAIASVIHQRKLAGNPIVFHCDGVQALGKIPIDLGKLGVDSYSLSAHKVYGPKGFGALLVRKGISLRAVTLGGRHEQARRAGTENIAGAAAFARAVQLVSDEERQRVLRLRDYFESELAARIEGIEINGGGAPRLPNTSNVFFAGVSGQALLIALDKAGIAVSTGSACSSGSVEPSPVLIAMGRSRKEASSCVRFSFGRSNTAADISQLVDALIASLGRLRAGREARMSYAS